MVGGEDDNDNDNDNDDDADIEEETIVSIFDRLCFEFGDEDAIVPAAPPSIHAGVEESSSCEKERPDGDGAPSSGVSYFELQEYSKNLAYQLQWRFQPDYVLVDCKRMAAAEAVATLACMRIRCPFVPVSCADQHRPGRLNAVVDHLRDKGRKRRRPEQARNNNNDDDDDDDDTPSVVAITVCKNDRDPILSVFQQANVHLILYLDEAGGIREQIQVPDYLPPPPSTTLVQDSNHPSPTKNEDDDLMVLFTSGTTGGSPKAVVGSHAATLRRIQWFHQNFEPSPRVIRKTALTFVDGITELWCTLLDRNSVLVTIPPMTLQSEGLAAILRAEPTQLLLLPSQIGQLLLLPKCETMQRLIISGEQASRTSVERVSKQYPAIQLINLYGQTETSGDVLCAVLSEMMDDETAFQEDVVAVGKPIGDTVVRINNKKDQEFVILGSQLSNGYLGRDGSFDSFATGDLGFCKDGIYYVKGRKDDVVKLNGIWTCPMEIETAFCRLYQTQGALACFVQDEAYIVCPDESACDRFSREDMYHRGKLPWNLIPKSVFCHEIPTSQNSGAGKASRKDAGKVVEQLLLHSSHRQEATPTLPSILCQTFNLLENQLDLTKSFIELGGDSAKAITVLFQLRKVFDRANYLTAVDLLAVDPISDLDLVLAGKKDFSRKKRRTKSTEVDSSSSQFDFVPRLAKRHSEEHISLDLLACVDSKPLVHDGLIYAACQGGVILKFTPSGTVEGYRHLKGWMIQADLVRSEDLLIVCAYTRDLGGGGVVIALSLDLKEEIWKVPLESPVKASPLLVDASSTLWVAAGTTEHTKVWRISAKTGKVCGAPISLPFPSISKPIASEHKIIYGCSSWEGGLFVVDMEDDKVKHVFEGEIGPVNGRDLISLPHDQVLVSDGYGALHCLNISRMVVKTIRLGSMPLTTPLILRDDGNIVVVLVGSNSGCLYAVSIGETNDMALLWTCECRASILGRPILNPKQGKNGSILVRTTAGQIIVVDSQGSIQWKRQMVDGEIWGDAESGDGEFVVFGARDARVHILLI